MRKYERNKLTLLALCAVLTLILVCEGTVIANESEIKNEKELTPEQKEAVRMAVDVLKLTGDAGTLPGKVDANTIDTKNGISAADLPEGVAAYGESDGGKIYIDRMQLDERSYPDPPREIKAIEDLKNLGIQEFLNLVTLAETLLHENTHNQQEEIDKEEFSGSDDNIKDCNSEWTELEAHYAELLFKLKLQQQLGDDAKATNLQLLIDALLKKIAEREEEVETKNGKVPKKVESPNDCTPLINEVYKKPTTPEELQQMIEDVNDRKDVATQERKEHGVEMLQQRKESKAKTIDPNTGGSLILPSGDAMVTVPGGSLSAPTYIGIHRMELTGLPAGRRTLTPVYEVSPGIALNPLSPARLSIRISDLNAIPAANIYRWNPNIPGRWVGQWELVDAGRSIDPNNMVSVDINQFGYFVVIDLRIAHNPCPESGAKDVPLDVILSWTAGGFAVAHDVYFGTSWDDVNAAAPSVPLGVYKGVQSANSYNPGLVALDTTYYWRVDEVNSTNPESPWKGQVWSFETPSLIIDPNMVLWYKFDEVDGDDAEDWSGYENHANVDGPDEGPDWDAKDGRFGGSLGFADETDVEIPAAAMATIDRGVTVTMWLKDADRPTSDNWVFGADGVGGSSIQAAVAGSAGDVIWRAGDDANDIITWDLDGQSAGDIAGWHNWAFVKDEVSGNISIYFDAKIVESNDVVTTGTLANVAGRQMRIGAAEGDSSTFVGRVDDFRVYNKALTAAEIRDVFRGGELDLAWSPAPGDNATDVSRDVVLLWSAGDSAVEHDVYFGTNWDDVNDATTATPGIYRGNYEPNEYDPCGLELETIYYWRIDEVNDTNRCKGVVWQFTTADYLVIDDMESYDNDGNSIFDTWIDGDGDTNGVGGNGTGSSLDFETDIVHDGQQAMVYSYDNNDSQSVHPYNWSEAALGWTGPQDWTANGVKALRLHFFGDPNNDANESERMYVALEDDSSNVVVVQYSGDADDVKKQQWQEWNIPLSDFNDGGVDLHKIKGLHIGFGDRNEPEEPGGTGVVYFDDIRLYRPWCVPEIGPDYDWSGNCIVDLADVGIMADEWLKADAVLDVEAPLVGPVAWWELDDGSGTTASDSSGNGNSGTLEGSTTWVAGWVGTHAVEFADDDARIRVPHSAELMPSTVSVTAWIYPAAASPYPARVLAKGIDDGDWEAYYMLFSDEQEVFWTIRDFNHWNHAVGSSDLDLNEWIHVGGTYDGDALKLYINGQLDAEDSTGGVGMLWDSNDLSIGNRADADNRAFIGKIDDVRVYDYGLNTAEVAYIATMSTGNPGTGYIPLVSPVNIYDEEPMGEKAVNFRDFAKLMGHWLEEELWPVR